MQQLRLRSPDDWHIHLRDHEVLPLLVRHVAQSFRRAIVMPNLKPPIIDAKTMLAYRQRILAACPPEHQFTPLMTLYLTESMTPATLQAAHDTGYLTAVKLYPAGATTNAQHGVANIDRCAAVLASMEERDIPLLVHAETPERHVDVFDREKRFLHETLSRVVSTYPRLHVVVEHLTTRDGLQFVMDGGDKIGATVTAHHLLLNRNALFDGGIRPHHYCLPVLKREEDREALVRIVTSGHPRFFLGTDSAPHARGAKETCVGCAGIYTAHAAMGLYAEVFDSMGALARLEDFASLNGPRFYGLPPNETHMVLVRDSWQVPASYTFATDVLIPFRAQESVMWRVATAHE